MNVLMIGVDKTSVGGMLTVVENYLNDKEFCNQTNLNYIATVIRSNKIKKITTVPEIISPSSILLKEASSSLSKSFIDSAISRPPIQTKNQPPPPQTRRQHYNPNHYSMHTPPALYFLHWKFLTPFISLQRTERTQYDSRISLQCILFVSLQRFIVPFRKFPVFFLVFYHFFYKFLKLLIDSMHLDSALNFPCADSVFTESRRYFL